MRRSLVVLASAALLAGCQREPSIASSQLPQLPEPISNNAVAGVELEGRRWLVSLLGLERGRGWQDTSSKAFLLEVGADGWSRLPDVPGDAGRLAGTAVALRGRVYVLGGYTVAEDGSEHSIASVHELDLLTGRYRELAPIPVPVDDTLSAAYRDRYIYLVSGWHETDNVALVQLYDVERDEWRQATQYPGEPVFGHAGGIVGDWLIVCDGVRVAGGEPGRRSFAITDGCYAGGLDPVDPTAIDWRRLPPHPGRPRYRMAATGSARAGGEVLFAGGSENPYNYDGIGYDGVAAEPEAEVFAYSMLGGQWKRYGRLDVATMDHRGLVELGGRFHLIGGMRAGQQVSAEVLAFELPGPGFRR